MDALSRQLADLAARLKATERAVFVTGAGLSVASGIAPYRKGPAAVWSRFVTEWGTLERFLDRTHAWWSEFWLQAHGPDLADKRPNPGHLALTELLRPRPRHAVITQNIDGLHRRAGLPEAQLIEVHGRHGLYVCSSPACDRYDAPREGIDLSVLASGGVPRCDDCGEPLRPLVLLFDERYDSHPFYQSFRAMKLLREAEVVVFVGTSFSVGITAYALDVARERGAALYNLNPEPAEGLINLVGPAEELLPALARATS